MSNNLFVLLMLGAMSAACTGSTPPKNENNQLSIEEQRKRPKPSPVKPHRQISIKILPETPFAEMALSTAEVILVFDQKRQTLTGDFTQADNVRYFNAQGDVVARVRYLKDGLQILNPDEQLLWQASLRADRLLISDNALSRNAFVIQKTNTTRYRVGSADKFLGDVRLIANKVTVKSFQTFEANTVSIAPGYGVLLLNNIPENMRLILLAELLRNEEYKDLP